MRTAPKFILSKSKLLSEDFCIINQTTGEMASLKLKSMGKIKKRFKAHICDRKHLCFSFITPSMAIELESMLPKHRISL